MPRPARRTGTESNLALRALSRLDKAGAPELGRALSAGDRYSPAERAEAARGLGRLGAAGQNALSDALPVLVPAADPASLATWATGNFGPLLVALESLHEASRVSAKRALYSLVNLTLPPDGSAPLARRIVRLRCGAARLLVNGAADEPMLRRCDPDEQGESGQLALLQVLGKRSVRGGRLATFRSLLGAKNARVREAALELMGSHPEIDDFVGKVGEALSAKEPGVVATAAELLTAHPDCARPGDVAPLGATLGAALDHPGRADDLETIAALLDAAAALHIDVAEKKLQSYCTHPNPTLREHAERGLTLLHASPTTCPPGPPRPKLQRN